MHGVTMKYIFVCLEEYYFIRLRWRN